MESMPKEFSLENFSQEKDDRVLLNLIQQRVDEMMAHDLELLMSYLYRLDISEGRIRVALQNQDKIPANEALARLIYERQLERLSTRKKYKQEPIKGWEF